MKRLLLVAVALLCAVLQPYAYGQTGYTTVTASSLKMSGALISVGKVFFTPVDRNGIAISFADASGSLNGPTAYGCAIAAGAITGMIQPDGTVSGTCKVPDATLTSPANILYKIQISNTSTGLTSSGLVFTLQQVVGLSGGTWALDAYGPPANTTNVQTMQAAHGTTTPTTCVSPSFFTNDTTHVVTTCIAGVEVQIGSATVTASIVASAITSQTGCSTAGYVWVPSTNTCVAQQSGSAPTAANVAAAITSQTGCNTAGYVWQPQSNTCVAQASGASPTASNVAAVITTQTGCSNAGYVWQPQSNTCIALPSSTAPTASNVAAAITNQTGCATAGYVWQPASNTCVANTAPTAANVAAAITTQTGCSNAGYVWQPSTNSCVVLPSSTAPTAANVAAAITTQTGCSTAGYLWQPQSNTCVAPAINTSGPFYLEGVPGAAGKTPAAGAEALVLPGGVFGIELADGSESPILTGATGDASGAAAAVAGNLTTEAGTRAAADATLTTNVTSLQNSRTTDETTLGTHTTQIASLNTSRTADETTLAGHTSTLNALGTPASYVSRFTGGLQNFFPLTEGTGSTVTDIVGAQTAAVVSGGTTSWTADGAMSFGGSYTGRMQATGITGGFLTMEIAYVPVTPTASTSTFNVAMAYATTSSSYLAPAIEDCSHFTCTGNSSALYNPTMAGFHICCTSLDRGSTTSVANGTLHVRTLVLTPNGQAYLYDNGQPVANPTGGAGTFGQSSLTNGYLEFGGSLLGYVNCTICGFKGKVYGVATYTGALTAQQVQANYVNAWRPFLQAKGVRLDQAQATNAGLGVQGTAAKPVVIIARGESITWAHGDSPYTTSNYGYIAASTVNGGNAFGIGLGQDSATAYVIDQDLPSLIAQFSPTATNVVLLFSNANGCKGGATTVTNGDESVYLLHSYNAILAAGGVPIIATGLSGAFPTTSAGDPGKDACNAAIRSKAVQLGLNLWDIASDPRVGADGAYAIGSGACTGGVAVYNSDHIHPTLCYQTFMGGNLAALVNDILYSAPATTTATTYAMTGMEKPLTANPSSNSIVASLPTCVGLSPKNAITVVNPQASGSNTVTVAANTNVYTAETVNGQASIVVPNATAKTFTPFNLGDVTAGCKWTATN